MRPSWKKRQEGADKDRSNGCPRPRNTARICLDGDDGREVLPSFRQGILSIFAWCRANGIVMDVSSVFGPGVEIVTTPPKGTFHLELEFKERLLEMVIRGKDLYVMGWRSSNGSFEIKATKSEKTTKGKKKFEEPKNYMLGEDVRPVYIGFNYVGLAPNGEPGDTTMGIYEFRRAFDALFEYKGGTPGRSVREAVGRISVFISESTRFPFVEDTACSSFVHNSVSRLRQPESDVLWLQRWSHCSHEVMEYIDCFLSGETLPAFRSRGLKIQSAAEIIPMIRVLYIDAYRKGKFARDPPPKVLGSQGWKQSQTKMQSDSEEPIDPPVQMEGGKNNTIKEKHGHTHTQSGKRSGKHVKGPARGSAANASSSRSSTERRYSANSCSSPSLDSWQGSVEENNAACKSLTTLMRGCDGSALRHLGGAKVSSSTPCSSAPPSASEQDNWRQCVQENRNVGKFLAALRRGSGRSSRMPLGLPASDCSTHSPALRKLCRLSYEMRRHRRTPIHNFAARTSATTKQHGAQALRATFANVFKVKSSRKTRLWSLLNSFLPNAWRKINQPTVQATQLLQTGPVTLETELRPKAPIHWAGAWVSRVLRRLRR